jgi:hypothetical protein
MRGSSGGRQEIMSPSAQVLKRALVKLLLAIAREFAIVLSITRESPDDHVKKAYRKVILRVHPDKPGGCLVRAKELNALWGNWQEAQRAPGRPAAKAAPASSGFASVVVSRRDNRKSFRINAEAVLLTYQSFRGASEWGSFVEFIRGRLKAWRCKYWSATLETNKDGSPHAHIMIQFSSVRDTTVKEFAFQGITPNASTTDLCGEGMSRRRLQQSIDRGMFYVWADKCGGGSFVWGIARTVRSCMHAHV